MTFPLFSLKFLIIGRKVALKARCRFVTWTPNQPDINCGVPERIYVPSLLCYAQLCHLLAFWHLLCPLGACLSLSLLFTSSPSPSDQAPPGHLCLDVPQTSYIWCAQKWPSFLLFLANLDLFLCSLFHWMTTHTPKCPCLKSVCDFFLVASTWFTSSPSTLDIPWLTHLLFLLPQLMTIHLCVCIPLLLLNLYCHPSPILCNRLLSRSVSSL